MLKLGKACSNLLGPRPVHTDDVVAKHFVSKLEQFVMKEMSEAVSLAYINIDAV